MSTWEVVSNLEIAVNGLDRGIDRELRLLIYSKSNKRISRFLAIMSKQHYIPKKEKAISD